MNEFGRSAQEQRAHDRLFYPGTETLINKLDIRDPARLSDAERHFAVERLRYGLPKTAHGFDAAGVRAIHHHMLQDVFDWAGQFREYTTGRNQASFARPEFIAPSLKDLHDSLKRDHYLKGLEPAAFSARGAEAVNYLNAIHPFVDGNGRTQRIWLRNLAEQAGYDLRLKRGDRDPWNEASKEGFFGKDAAMKKFISERLQPLRDRDRSHADTVFDPDRDLAEAKRHEAPRPSPTKPRSRSR